MNDRTLLHMGLIGTVITALCCFTPILAILLGVVGLSTVLGWLDYVLMPILAVLSRSLLTHFGERDRRHD
jgi:mercuric ion transport protein